jgi:hypothetical protein
MDLGRFPIKFYGGPYGGQSASIRLLYDLVTICDGPALQLHCYHKVGELEYGYSPVLSGGLPKTAEGREQFLRLAAGLPRLDLQFDAKNPPEN